jgi:hypothetical protein
MPQEINLFEFVKDAYKKQAVTPDPHVKAAVLDFLSRNALKLGTGETVRISNTSAASNLQVTELKMASYLKSQPGFIVTQKDLHDKDQGDRHWTAYSLKLIARLDTPADIKE